MNTVPTGATDASAVSSGGTRRLAFPFLPALWLHTVFGLVARVEVGTVGAVSACMVRRLRRLLAAAEATARQLALQSRSTHWPLALALATADATATAAAAATATAVLFHFDVLVVAVAVGLADVLVVGDFF